MGSEAVIKAQVNHRSSLRLPLSVKGWLNRPTLLRIVRLDLYDFLELIRDCC